MEHKIQINESFSDDEMPMFDKLESRDFESLELLDLKLDAEEISQENEIRELVSYNSIKKNLSYTLTEDPIESMLLRKI